MLKLCLHTGKTYAWVVGVGAVFWAVLAVFVAPSVIRQAYEGRSLAFLNDLIEGRDVHLAEYYLAIWRGMALKISALLTGLALVGALSIRKRRGIKNAVLSSVDQLPRIRARDVLVIALTFGIVSGLVEAAWGALDYWVLLGPRAWIRAEVVWMAPLAASLTLLSIATLVTVPQRWISLGDKLNALVVFGLAGLCLYGLGRSLRAGLHPAALVVLAAGFAALITRSLARDAPSFLSWARRVAVVGSSTLGLWALVLVFLRFAGPYSTSTATKLDAEEPNILLIVWDTVRARSLSLYGYERQTTPVLDSLGRTGVVFEAAVSAAPWTLPSHASLFTGRYHHELSVTRETPLDDTFVTLAEVLGDRGYRTAGFVANEWATRKHGLGRGFDVYEDRPPITAQAILDTWHISRRVSQRVAPLFSNLRITADHINGSFLRWVETDDERPFFAFLNLFDAHEPYLPPGAFGFEFSQNTPLHAWNYWETEEHSPAQLQELTDAYDSCIYYLDYQLGRLIDGLRDLGLLDNTLLIITADHGESLGEHQSNLLGHSNNIYYDVLNVPLMFYYPARIPGGIRHTAAVGTVDISATIFDLVAPGSENPFPGRSLLPALLGEDLEWSGATRPLVSQANPAGWHLAGPSWPMSKGPLYSLVDGTTHYIVNARGEEQLFYLDADPWEQDDRSGGDQGSQDAERLRDALAEVMGARAR